MSHNQTAETRTVDAIRTLPRLTDESAFFWTSGADGKLRFLRCQDCRTYQHPPQPVCPKCLSRNVIPETVSGTGTIVSYTVNHKVWNPTVPVPYAIVVVELDEQRSLRLVSNLVGEFAVPRIGQRVEVRFEQASPEIFLPLFAVVDDR